MTSPTATEAPRTRERILDAALALFAEKGYDATSMREISEQLGITKAALYYHFDSKADIVRAMLADTEARVTGLVDWARAQPDTPALRREVNAALEAFLSESIPVWRVEIRAFIKETLMRQEPAAFARRLELQVGRDLQFVRVNGTILGALIGLAIHAAG